MSENHPEYSETKGEEHHVTRAETGSLKDHNAKQKERMSGDADDEEEVVIEDSTLKAKSELAQGGDDGDDPSTQSEPSASVPSKAAELDEIARRASVDGEEPEDAQTSLFKKFSDDARESLPKAQPKKGVTDLNYILESRALTDVLLQELQFGYQKKPGLAIRTRTYAFSAFKRTFLGNEAVTWLVKYCEAKKIAIRLVDPEEEKEREEARRQMEGERDEQAMILGMFAPAAAKKEKPAMKVGVNDPWTLKLRAIGRAMRDKQKGVPVKDRREGFVAKRHKNCWFGHDAVKWLIARKHARNPIEAVEIGRQLMRAGEFHHVAQAHVFENSHWLYRWDPPLEDYDPSALPALTPSGSVMTIATNGVKGPTGGAGSAPPTPAAGAKHTHVTDGPEPSGVKPTPAGGSGAGLGLGLGGLGGGGKKKKKFRLIRRVDCVMMFRELMKRGLMQHVAGGNVPPASTQMKNASFEDKDYLYRFVGKAKKVNAGKKGGWLNMFGQDYAILRAEGKRGARGAAGAQAGSGAAGAHPTDIDGLSATARRNSFDEGKDDGGVGGRDSAHAHSDSMDDVLRAATSSMNQASDKDPAKTPSTTLINSPVTPKGTLKGAKGDKRSDMFASKVRACRQLFTVKKSENDKAAKSAKTEVLKELKTFFVKANNKPELSDENLGELVEMIGVNLFRTLPNPDNSGVVFRDRFDLAQEVVHVKDPVSSWVHLELVYDLLTRLISCAGIKKQREGRWDYGDFTTKLSLYINSNFVRKLIQLFRSQDRRERRVLRSVLTLLYTRFVSLRYCVLQEMAFTFHRFMLEMEEQTLSNASTEVRLLLSVLAQVLTDVGWANPPQPSTGTGGALTATPSSTSAVTSPSKAGSPTAQPKILPLPLENLRAKAAYFQRVIMPLHGTPIDLLLRFRQELAQCVTWFIQHDPHPFSLPLPKSKQGRYWPVWNYTAASKLVADQAASPLSPSVPNPNVNSTTTSTVSPWTGLTTLPPHPLSQSHSYLHFHTNPVIFDNSGQDTSACQQVVYAYTPLLALCVKFLLKCWPIQDSWKQVFFLEELSTLFNLNKIRKRPSGSEEGGALPASNGVAVSGGFGGGLSGDRRYRVPTSQVAEAGQPDSPGHKRDATVTGGGSETDECEFLMCEHVLDWQLQELLIRRICSCIELVHLEVSQTAIKAFDQWQAKGGLDLLVDGHPVFREVLLPIVYPTLRRIGLTHKFKPARMRLDVMRKLLESKLRELKPDKVIGLKPPALPAPGTKKPSPSSSMSTGGKKLKSRAEMWSLLTQQAQSKKETAVVAEGDAEEKVSDEKSSSTALALSLTQSLQERFNPAILGIELMQDAFVVGDEMVTNNTWNRVTIRFEEQLSREQKEEEEKALAESRNIGVEPSSARNEDDDDDDATVESAEAEYSGGARGTEALEIATTDSAQVQSDAKEKDPDSQMRDNRDPDSQMRSPDQMLDPQENS